MLNENALKAKAKMVEACMRERGAVRDEDGKITAYLSRYDLAKECDFFLGDWVKIKEQMLRNGVTLRFMPGRGHFIGGRGEEIYNVISCGNMASGWAGRASAYLEALPNHNKKERFDFAKSRGIDLSELERIFKKEDNR